MIKFHFKKKYSSYTITCEKYETYLSFRIMNVDAVKPKQIGQALTMELYYFSGDFLLLKFGPNGLKPNAKTINGAEEVKKYLKNRVDSRKDSANI